MVVKKTAKLQNLPSKFDSLNRTLGRVARIQKLSRLAGPFKKPVARALFNRSKNPTARKLRRLNASFEKSAVKSVKRQRKKKTRKLYVAMADFFLND